MASTGPLAGMTVIEMAAIGPVPHCGMVLRELGADVLRIERSGPSGLGIDLAPGFDALARGKRVVALDLKATAGRDTVLEFVAAADILIEGFRPGVMERLGLGPVPCLARNPRLIYGRLPGWGDSGPMAGQAGHDLNYLGLSGALAAMGPPAAPPPVPLNLVADFGGGAMQLAIGVLAAMLQARQSGSGQVVAASILEGTLALTPMMHGMQAAGAMSGKRHDNVLDGGAPFYRCYQARGGSYVAVAAIEAKFYRVLLEGLGLLGALDPAAQMDRAQWPATHARLAETFLTRTRDDWAAYFLGINACVTPVLTFDEATRHPQAAAAFVQTPGGWPVPRATPRFLKLVDVRGHDDVQRSA